MKIVTLLPVHRYTTAQHQPTKALANLRLQQIKLGTLLFACSLSLGGAYTLAAVSTIQFYNSYAAGSSWAMAFLPLMLLLFLLALMMIERRNDLLQSRNSTAGMGLQNPAQVTVSLMLHLKVFFEYLIGLVVIALLCILVCIEPIPKGIYPFFILSNIIYLSGLWIYALLLQDKRKLCCLIGTLQHSTLNQL